MIKAENRVPFLLLLCAAILPFLRLGIGEIQPWDESLYVIRAVACLKFGCWLDQSAYSVGHLYSSVHPSVGVWLIAASRALFEDSTVATRLPMAFAASGCTIGVYVISRFFVSVSSATLGAISFATAGLVLWYSHTAQLEIPMLLFAIWSAVLLVRSVQKDSLLFAVLSGVVLALALSTKFAIALFVVPLLLGLPWMLVGRGGWRYALIAVVSGGLLSIPWLIFMSVRHPEFSGHVLHSLSEIRSGNYSPAHMAWYYYLNQLLICVPLLGLVLWRSEDRSRNMPLARLRLVLWVWLTIVFVIISLVGTKMPHFALLPVVPAVLLVSVAAEKFDLNSLRRPSNLVVSLLVVFLLVWSSSEQLRLLARHAMPIGELITPSIQSVLISLVLFAVLVAVVFGLDRQTGRPTLVLSSLLIALAVLHLLNQHQSVYENGARPIAGIIESLPNKNHLVILHSGYAHEEYAPQLGYYTGGWNLGWIPGKTSNTFSWQEGERTYQPDTSRDVAIIQNFTDRYYHPSQLETGVLKALSAKLRGSFEHEQDFRSYTLYY